MHLKDAFKVKRTPRRDGNCLVRRQWRCKWDSWARGLGTYWRENSKLKTNIGNWNLDGGDWGERVRRVAWFAGFYLGQPKLGSSGAAGCVVGEWRRGVRRRSFSFILDHRLCRSLWEGCQMEISKGKRRAQIWNVRSSSHLGKTDLGGGFSYALDQSRS